MRAVPIEERFWTHVDKSGECWQWTGHRNSQGYGRVTVGRKSSMAHRVVYEMEVGKIPAGMVVDHICHTPACVRPDHLRACTQKENNEHQALESCSASGFRGVTWHKGTKRWHARVRHHGKMHFVGSFTDKNEAREAAKAKRLELFTHNNDDRQVAA